MINGIKCILVWRQKTINTDLKGILIDNSLKLEMLEKHLALLRRASFFRVVHVEEFQAQIPMFFLFVITPTPCLTLLLVLGKKCADQISCQQS